MNSKGHPIQAAVLVAIYLGIVVAFAILCGWLQS